MQWLIALQRHAHNRGEHAQEGWRISLGTGSQDLIHKTFEILTECAGTLEIALIDRSAGDYVLMETPAYSCVLLI